MVFKGHQTVSDLNESNLQLKSFVKGKSECPGYHLIFKQQSIETAVH